VNTDAIVFQVKDSGVGIPSEFQQHLFEPFHRANNVGKMVGTRLGLAGVKKCLEIHRGEITVESELGVGTTFTVRIPQNLTQKRQEAYLLEDTR
jgi:signal transduction histidine kinase